MLTDGIRGFVDRDWEAMRAQKEAYWGERIARLGPIEAFRITDELRRQVLAQYPGWPDPDSRRADVSFHVRLVELLRRVSPTRRP